MIQYKVLGWALRDRKVRKAKNIVIKKALIINLQGMGDVLMTTALISELARQGMKVDVLVNSKISAELLDKNIVHKTHFMKGKLDTINKINKEHYDLIYLAHGAGPKSALMFTSLRANIKASHLYNLGGNYCSFGAQITLQQTAGMHRIEENLKLLGALGLPKAKQTRYHLRALEKKEQEKVRLFWKKHQLDKKKIIGIHPGGDKNNLQKRYPIEKYLQFAHKAPSTHKIVFFIGPDEQDLAEQLHKEIIFTGSIGETAAAIQKCSVLINTDSGLGHVAAAVGTKTLTIVGPTNWLRTRPYGKKDKILQSKQMKKPQERRMEEGYIKKKAAFPKTINIREIL